MRHLLGKLIIWCLDVTPTKRRIADGNGWRYATVGEAMEKIIKENDAKHAEIKHHHEALVDEFDDHMKRMVKVDEDFDIRLTTCENDIHKFVTGFFAHSAAIEDIYKRISKKPSRKRKVKHGKR